MANYLIYKQGDPLHLNAITIADGTKDVRFTVPLLGQNYVGYGAAIAQNQLNTLENFCSDAAPSNAIRGQLWYKMPPGYTPGTQGSMLVWTGADPSDVGFNTYTDGSQVAGNINLWVVVGPEGIAGGDIGSIGTPYNNLYVDNITSTGLGSFVHLFVGSGGNSLDVTATNVLPNPDSTNDSTGMFLGNSTHRYREVHVRNAFLHGSINVGDFSNNKNVKLIADTTQNYTLLPDPSQTVHLGMSSTLSKRFESVNAKTANLISLEVSTANGEGVGTDLIPKTDSTLKLGSATYKYNNIYSTSATIETVKRYSATSKVGESGSPFLEMHADTFYGIATEALYADIAERYESDGVYEYGTVMKFGGDKEITITTSENDVDVYGVISKEPAFMMNAAAGDNNTHPYIALAGRIPVKVVGVVKKHQKLVSSNIHGVAKAVDAADVTDLRQVIGRALADKNDNEIGYVEAAVGVR